MTIASRLAALERKRQHGDTEIILVHGGFGGDEMMHATAGAFTFDRLDGETLADFMGRTQAAAREARQPFVVIGGLPDMPRDIGPVSSLPDPLMS